MWPRYKAKIFCLLPCRCVRFDNSIWTQRDYTIFPFLQVTEALKHFRVVSVTKLSNCRVPSSGRERAIQTNYKHKFPVIKSRS